MKKLLALAFAILFAILLCIGCGSDVAKRMENAPAQEDTPIFSLKPTENYAEKIESEDIYIITDAETGVQYIVYREKFANAGMGGITPRLNADGSLYVVETEKGE